MERRALVREPSSSFIQRLAADHFRAHLHRQREKASAIYCGHANEYPAVCDCPPDCYCQSNSCKDRKWLSTYALAIILPLLDSSLEGYHQDDLINAGVRLGVSETSMYSHLDAMVRSDYLRVIITPDRPGPSYILNSEHNSADNHIKCPVCILQRSRASLDSYIQDQLQPLLDEAFEPGNEVPPTRVRSRFDLIE